VKNLLRSKRAVSPVIAAVLMIMVAIIGMSILFAFFVNYARDFQLGSGSAVLESFVIEDVWIKDSGEVELWVYNVGKAEITITSVYVDNVLVAKMNPPIEIGLGKHEKLDFTIQTPVNGPYTLRVVTERGSSVEGRYL